MKADLASKTLVSAAGESFKYQTLVIATGSTVSLLEMWLCCIFLLFVICHSMNFLFRVCSGFEVVRFWCTRC